MKVLITGATGLLGGYLLHALLQHNEHIRALVLPVENAEKLIEVMMFGTDNRHSVEKARRELGYEPKVDLQEGIKLAAAWFNAGGMDQPLVIQANQYAPLAGVRKL